MHETHAYTKLSHYSDFSSKVTTEFIQVLFCLSFSLTMYILFYIGGKIYKALQMGKIYIHACVYACVCLCTYIYIYSCLCAVCQCVLIKLIPAEGTLKKCIYCTDFPWYVGAQTSLCISNYLVLKLSITKYFSTLPSQVKMLKYLFINLCFLCCFEDLI